MSGKQPGTHRPQESAKQFAKRMAKQMRQEAVELRAKADKLEKSASVMDGREGP